MTARILPLRCPDIWAKAREVAPRQKLEARADMLSAVMAATLARSGVDLMNRRHCRAALAGLYAERDVETLLDRAIEEAAELGTAEAKLKLARAL